MSLPHLKEARAFLGQQTFALFLLSIVCGLTVFVAEVAFAYSMQLLLRVMGLMGSRLLELPGPFAGANRLHVLSFILVVGCARSFLVGFNGYLKFSFLERFLHNQRALILDWSFRSPQSSGNRAVTLLSAHVQAAGNALSAAQMALVSGIISFGMLAFLFTLSARTTATFMLVLAVLVYPLYVLQKTARMRGREQSNMAASSVSRLIVGMKNQLLLRILGLLARERTELHSLLDRALEGRLRFQKLSALTQIYTQILGVLTIVLVVSWKRHEFGLTSAIIVSFFYLLFRFLQLLPSFFQNIAAARYEWHHVHIVYEWWRDSLKNHSDVHTLPAPGSRDPVTNPLGWELRDVRYTYPDTTTPIFDGISMQIDPGSTFVVTGPSGSGKSTLLDLLLGQLSHQSGEVKSILEREVVGLRDHLPRVLANIAYVGPETYLIEGTIRDNLLYSLDHLPTAQEIDEVLAQAECGFVNELPNGLDHVISFVGTGLSAGQKQRLSLARALLRKPRALILDEATSNLDIETDRKLLNTLAKLKGKVTLVISTHRMEWIKLADRHLNLPLEST